MSSPSVGISLREAEEEPGAADRRPLVVIVPAVGFDDRFANGQSDAPRGAALAPAEGLEDALALEAGDTRAFVVDPQLDEVADLPPTNGESSRLYRARRLLPLRGDHQAVQPGSPVRPPLPVRGQRSPGTGNRWRLDTVSRYTPRHRGRSTHCSDRRWFHLRWLPCTDPYLR